MTISIQNIRMLDYISLFKAYHTQIDIDKYYVKGALKQMVKKFKRAHDNKTIYESWLWSNKMQNIFLFIKKNKLLSCLKILKDIDTEYLSLAHARFIIIMSNHIRTHLFKIIIQQWTFVFLVIINSGISIN